jgi:Transposase IS116/IS110/IS902 family
VYQQKVLACDAQIESVLKRLSSGRGHKDVRADGSSPPRQKGRQSNGLAFDVGGALHFLLGKDLTRKHGIGPYLALKLVSECGDDLSAWPSAKHFTSWLCLAPSNKISGGKVLSSRTRRSGSRAASRAFAIGRRGHRSPRDRAGCVLPAALRPRRLGESHHRDGAQNRGTILQCAASRYGLRRSRRLSRSICVPRQDRKRVRAH